MKYEIQRTAQFKKDFKLALKRNCNIEKLQEIITILANGETLPESCYDHPLRGDYGGYRECHIEPDWLLVSIRGFSPVIQRFGGGLYHHRKKQGGPRRL